jgi:hypothetical protein
VALRAACGFVISSWFADPAIGLKMWFAFCSHFGRQSRWGLRIYLLLLQSQAGEVRQLCSTTLIIDQIERMLLRDFPCDRYHLPV